MPVVVSTEINAASMSRPLIRFLAPAAACRAEAWCLRAVASAAAVEAGFHLAPECRLGLIGLALAHRDDLAASAIAW